MENKTNRFLSAVLLIACSCNPAGHKLPAASGSTFKDDADFLNRFTNILILEEPSGKGKVAIAPALQGRVMTSTARGDAGDSFGWINKALFESGDTLDHINPFGGEERFWLGPEGGQFSIFFEKEKEFTLENWFTPKLIDLDAFDIVSSSSTAVTFTKTASLQNYSGTQFNIRIDREIRVLAADAAYQELGVQREAGLDVVAFQTNNSVQNTGSVGWSRKTGILSIWLLGMLKPSPGTTIVVPFNAGSEATLGPVVNDDYFGKVPPDRLRVGDGVIFFKGDGAFRSKIGLSPKRAKNVLGSYDAGSNTLTIVKYNKPAGPADYVNSKWEIQDKPFNGDVINSYNDGPPAPGAKPLGPFNELESSSPAVELKPGERVVHTQTTFHFQGDEESISRLTEKILGVSVLGINGAFVKK